MKVIISGAKLKRKIGFVFLKMTSEKVLDAKCSIF